MKSTGQSLISILVAVFILVVLALIVSGMATLAIRLATEGERRIVALGIANEELEYARSQLYQDLAPRSKTWRRQLTWSMRHCRFDVGNVRV